MNTTRIGSTNGTEGCESRESTPFGPSTEPITTEQNIIKTKVGLLDLPRQSGKVSRACRIMGYSRDSFHRFKDLYETVVEAALWGVGRRIYQRTFIDTYAKVAFAKHYDRKTALTTADLPNDRVLPFYGAHGIPLCGLLADRGQNIVGAGPVPRKY